MIFATVKTSKEKVIKKKNTKFDEGKTKEGLGKNDKERIGKNDKGG